MTKFLARLVNRLADFRFWWLAHFREPIIDDTSKCPGCGIRAKHALKIVEAAGDHSKPDTYVEHTCARCGAKFHETTILPGEKWHRFKGSLGIPILKIATPINDEKPFSPGR